MQIREHIPAADIATRITGFAKLLSHDYQNRALTLVGVLSGCVPFITDVSRALTIPHQLAYIRASSYPGKSTTAGPLNLDLSGLGDVRGRDVVILDDIFDTGRTLSAIHTRIVTEHGARSVASGVLLCKQGTSQVSYRPTDVLFHVANVFVVGYGLDYGGDFRHLPYIGVLGE